MKHYLLFYEAAADFVTRRSEFRAAHLAKAWQASQCGELLLAGAFADPIDGAVLLFKGESQSVAEDFARADPYVTSGAVKRWYVREWTTVVGEQAMTPVYPDAVASNATGRLAVAFSAPGSQHRRGAMIMSTVTTADGVQIFYKDWGRGQPIVFHHGWPLSADDWDAQMLFFLHHGYRVVAFDRRGHGRSSQVSEGHDMDHYAADAAAVVEHLDLREAVHIGHSTGGGVVARYVARHGKGRVAKAVLMSAVTPMMVKTPGNPGGLPIEVFDGLRAALAANRAQFFRDVSAGPFYGFNRPGAKPLESVIANWWRQGMMGSAKAHYDGIKAFSETDQTEDLKSIQVPTLVMHGEDDQVVPYKDAALLSIKLLRQGTLKLYPGFPHGMLTTHADVINRDLLDFIRS